MQKSEFGLWIEEVENFLGYKLTIQEFTIYLNMYYDIKYSDEV